MIGYFLVVSEENRRCWVRADEIGTFYETSVYPKQGPGRPPAGPPKAVSVICLLLSNNNRIHAKNETLETVLSKMRQALGTQVLLVDKPSTEPGATVRIPAEDAADRALQ